MIKMYKHLDAVLIFLTLSKCRAKEPELPLCPANMPYFPQSLPMHCRMPINGNQLDQFPNPTMPPFPPRYYASPPPGDLPNPIPYPIPPGMPPGFPPGLPPGMPGPGPMPMPMPMPLPMPGPAHKLPVIVMPFYSPDPSYKKAPRPPQPPRYRDKHSRHLEVHTRRPHYNTDTSSDDSTSSDTSSESSSEKRGWWRGGARRSGRKVKKHKPKKRRHNKPRDILTPILQYVTKDGYVIFEKKITKNEAKDWLSMKKPENNPEPDQVDVHNVANKDLDMPNDVNPDVEILNKHKEKSKEEVDPAHHAHKAPKKHYPNKLRRHRTTEEKDEVPE